MGRDNQEEPSQDYSQPGGLNRLYTSHRLHPLRSNQNRMWIKLENTFQAARKSITEVAGWL